MYAYLEYRDATIPSFIVYVENNCIVTIYDILCSQYLGGFENRDINEFAESLRFKIIPIDGKVI